MAYFTNTKVSGPIDIPGLKSDVDLNGLQFSYEYGVFFAPVGKQLPITMPPPFDMRNIR